MIHDDVVEEVRARADLVTVIGEVTPLKRSGKDYKGKCPFHEDRTPSFYVVPSKGIYHCFGCGAKGDVFRFLMERQGMTFLDAVRSLGERFGVEIRETGRGEEGRESPWQAHYEANAFARDYFRRCLEDPEVGAEARAYLLERGISPEIQERFGLGYAPEGWRGLREAAAKHGIPDELLLEVGLLTVSQKAAEDGREREPYDRFRGRIIFPIENMAGRVAGFGGRILPTLNSGAGAGGKGAPKYLNSPESPVYHKGEILYAMGWARNAIRREKISLVTEGYMDVVALAAAGIDHAVATLGTSLTPEHAKLLGRTCTQAILLFDSDEAGLRAAFRGADVLLAAGIQPLVVTLPDGEDPDSMVRKGGAPALKPFLDAAVDVVDRKLQLLEEKGFFLSIERTRSAVDKLIPTLRAATDPTLRDIYVARVAARTGVRRETLEEELRSQPSTPWTSGGAGAGGGSAPGGEGFPAGARWNEGGHSGDAGGRSERRARPNPLPQNGAERKLLLVLLRTEGWAERAAERIGPEEFRDPLHRAIFQWLLEARNEERFPEGASPELIQRIEALRGDPEELDSTEQVFEDSIRLLLDQSFDAPQQALQRQLDAAAALGDTEEERRIAAELIKLRRERSGRWNTAWREGPAPPKRAGD
jgi:DNA primase